MGVELELAYDDMEEIGMLFTEYTAMLVERDPIMAVSLRLQNYDVELAHLRDKYGTPDGRLYLARVDGNRRSPSRHAAIRLRRRIHMHALRPLTVACAIALIALLTPSAYADAPAAATAIGAPASPARRYQNSALPAATAHTARVTPPTAQRELGNSFTGDRLA